MRKLSALFILIAVFFPLAFAAMTLTAIRPWILDRSFYERLVNDERLYETLLTEDLSNRFDEEIFTPVEQLPLDALSVALREVVTLDYLRTQSLNVVNEVFDYLEGRERKFELSLDITPIKAALAGEGGIRFAAALAAAIPNCTPGQQPIAPGGSLTRCIAVGESIPEAAEQIAAALPTVLEDTPDQIILDGQGYIRMNWYDYAWFFGSDVHAVLDVAILMMIFTAVGAGLVGAFLGGDDLRGRLKWLSASLFAAGSLFLCAGLVLAPSLIGGPIRSGVASTRWSTPYSERRRAAVADVVVPVSQQVGSGILISGIIACLMALALLSWS